jgi:hypothetical protein
MLLIRKTRCRINQMMQDWSHIRLSITYYHHRINRLKRNTWLIRDCMINTYRLKGMPQGWQSRFFTGSYTTDKITVSVLH